MTPLVLSTNSYDSCDKHVPKLSLTPQSESDLQISPQYLSPVVVRRAHSGTAVSPLGMSFKAQNAWPHHTHARTGTHARARTCTHAHASARTHAHASARKRTQAHAHPSARTHAHPPTHARKQEIEECFTRSFGQVPWLSHLGLQKSPERPLTRTATSSDSQPVDGLP